MSPFGILGIAVVAAVVFVILLISALAARYVKVGPNQALIVYGRTKLPRVIVGGGTFVFPVIERAQGFSLELMSFDVAPQQNLYTNQGVSVRVEAVTQLKVRNDDASIRTAAEQFLSKTFDQRQALIRLVMEGHLRGIVGQLTVEQIVKEPEMVSEKMRNTSSADLAKMGLEVVSFTIKEVRDENEFIANMGRPEIERIKKEANIAAAQAARDTQIQQAGATREAAVAKAEAEGQRMTLEGEGRATALRAQAAAEGEAAKIRGAAEAEASRLRGLAEADVIRAKGEAEAEAMRVKAAAYHEYNQAAVLDKVISNLPEIVRAIAEPLAKVDKISIVSTGGPNGSNLGASRVTGDVVNMLAQVPAILEALTGTRMSDLMAQVPGLNTVDARVNGAKTANGTRDATGDAKASDADATHETATPETEPVNAEQSEAGRPPPADNPPPRPRGLPPK